MWVKRGSSGFFNATLAETNLAQSLTLSILEEDGEKFLHPRLFRLRLLAVASLSRGPVCSNESRGELGDWAFNTAALCNHIRRRWGCRVKRIRGNPWCDLIYTCFLLYWYCTWRRHQFKEEAFVKKSKKPKVYSHSHVTAPSLSQVQVHVCSRSVCGQSRS